MNHGRVMQLRLSGRLRANGSAKCPVTAHGVKEVMASVPREFKERCCTKSEADACEGKPDEAVEGEGCGNIEHIIRDIKTIVIIQQSAYLISKFSDSDAIISSLFTVTCAGATV